MAAGRYAFSPFRTRISSIVVRKTRSTTSPRISSASLSLSLSLVSASLKKRKTWFSDAASSAMPPQIPLDDLISIWNFGINHDIDFLPELCESYLAKNFMWAVSCKSFVDVPYSLLLGCIKHQHLTIESEMHLSDALLIWLDANTGDSEGLSTSDNYYGSILEQIHPSLLPLWFTAGKRRSCHLSKLADESITSVLRLTKIPSIGSISFLEDGDLNDTSIRLTEYSKIFSNSSG
ncbi:hypothetical protein TIFTF001_022316 [Ficus carica]|uniref:BACK domain-containing protein n=1 Tax=Ficus carica TaxID=3494 RepID=A0AA88AHL2_FICCA|nr:hypothetical protein TIFTF001_022316 [Ficus carica]